MSAYSIGQMAERSGVRPVTIRYYEKAGLMERPPRLKNGYRSYQEKDLARLNFIRHCRRHNLSLDAIRKLARLKEAPDSSCVAVNDIIDREIEKLEELSASIGALKDHLTDLRRKCPGDGPVARCPILKDLSDENCSAESPGALFSDSSPRIIWPETEADKGKRRGKESPEKTRK
ncbi:MAG: MerR family transcriptional regulator [Deltaproteobacteria bacterium]|jgi:DNA-binding transcriptional MerR regulator|nr:MerR family transcriptional regulator [Deltaproteobacteria bacterium]